MYDVRLHHRATFGSMQCCIHKGGERARRFDSSKRGAVTLQTIRVAVLVLLCSLIWTPVFSQRTALTQSPSVLRKTLLSRDTSDDEWKAAEKQFQELPAKDALRSLFPEVAKGLPDGFTYAAYNCFEPLKDRKVPAWGEFCVVHWLWCKELACPANRHEVTNAMLELWSQPVSFYGQMALLQGLCGEPEAEGRMASLFRDSAADARLRTEAGVCLLNQNAKKYHGEVVAFAEQSQPKLRERLFDELASPPHRRVSGIDPAVVRIGFDLLFDEADKQEKARRLGQITYDYGQFIYASRLDTYLGTTFVPDQKLAIYAGAQGIERWYRDSVANALDWWSKHKHEYAD